MNKKSLIVFCALLVVGAMLVPELSFASVESTLSTLQTRLISTVLPAAAILGLVFAAFSFVLGSPNAKNHLILAMIGAAVGFGAPSIIGFIRGFVQ
jgi:hypothetical protein